MGHYKLKNGIILGTYVISLVPKLFYKNPKEIELGIFIKRCTRIDFAAIHYSIVINFFILAYCMHYNKGLDKKVTRLIMIISVLDIMHLALFAKQKFGLVKIFIAVLLVVFYEIYKKRSR